MFKVVCIRVRSSEPGEFEMMENKSRYDEFEGHFYSSEALSLR
jgi:hypothetical protein